MLRLYPAHLEIQGKLYSLSDLRNFEPSYRHILGVSSMRLDLQFVAATIVVRGLADIGQALKLIAYLNSWNDATSALTGKELYEASQLSFSAMPTPQQLVLSASKQTSFWEYDAHEQSTDLVDVPVQAAAMDTAPELAQPVSSPPSEPSEPSESALPWTAERCRQHDQRLRRLQVEREIRFYGFDAAALAKRLRDEPLEPISVPIPLHEGEIAYYRTEARLFDEFSGAEKRAKSKAKDQGALLLTNRRMIYLGQKRHIMLGYERVLQVEHVKGALVLSTEYWTRKQFFGMQYPLECAMYLEHALHNFQSTFPSAHVQTQAFDMPVQPVFLLESDTSEESKVPD